MCQSSTCSSERIWFTSLKVSDGFYLRFEDGKAYQGYAPPNTGITTSNEDYAQFRYCADCGQIQGDFPAQRPEENSY